MHLFGKLSKKEIDSISKPGRYADGGGLYLVVGKSGGKSWVLRVVIKGQRTDLGLGGLSYTPLQEARRKAFEFRSVARNGGDPRLVKRTTVPTFAALAQFVFEERLPTWKNQKHAKQWISTLEVYAYPVIGHSPVDDIDSSDIFKVISPMWTDKHETARRVLQRIGVVLDVARARKLRAGQNPVEEVKHLNVLPKVAKIKGHHGAMKWQNVPQF